MPPIVACDLADANSNSTLLNIAVPIIQDGLLKAATKYLEWGVDGLHLAESGLAVGVSNTSGCS